MTTFQRQTSLFRNYSVFFLVVLSLAAILARPCALLHPSTDFDDNGTRWALLAVSLVAALIVAVLCRLRGETKRGIVAAVGFMLLGLGLRFMPPGMSGHASAFELPALLFLVAPALFVVLTFDWRASRWPLVLFGIFSLAVVIQSLNDKASFREVFALLSYVLVPLAIAVLIHTKQLRQNLLSTLGMVLWTFSVLFSVEAALTKQWTMGISANPNWFSCIVIGTAPWAFLYLRRLLSQLTMHRAIPCMIAIAIVAPTTAWVLYYSQTRALVVALGLYVLFFLFWAIKRVVLRLCLVILLGAGLVALATYHLPRVRTAVRQDVRLPMWFSSLRLVARYPVIGAGPARIAREIPDLLADSDYHKRFVAADVMEHPHNEIINIMLHLGIPAAIAWALLLLPLLRNPLKLSWTVRLAQFSAINMLILGLADKSLTRHPASIWWLVVLGICWSPHIRAASKRTWHDERPLIWRTGLWAAGVLLIFLTFLAINDGIFSWLKRRGDQFAAAGHTDMALASYEQALRHKANHVPVLYTIAGLRMSKKFSRERSFEDLDRVYRLNPNYAHINRQLNRFYLMTGNPEQALSFILRDVELFPENVFSYQRYVRSVIAADKSSELANAIRILNGTTDGKDTPVGKYAQRVVSLADFSGTEDLPLRWHQAMLEEGSDEAAMEAGNQIIQAINGESCVDPRAPWFRGEEWPASAVGMSFTRQDVHYWRSILLREKLWEDPELQANQDPLKIVHMLYDRVTIDATAKGCVYPHELWETKAGSIDSAYLFIAFMSKSPTLIQDAPASFKNPSPARNLYLAQDKLLWRVHVGRRTARIMNADDVKRFLKPDKQKRLKVIAMPEDFLTRHQVLSALTIRFYKYRRELQFPVLPSLQLYRARNHFEPYGVKELAPIPVWIPEGLRPNDSGDR